VRDGNGDEDRDGVNTDEIRLALPMGDNADEDDE
jgi:hypothetical protein